MANPTTAQTTDSQSEKCETPSSTGAMLICCVAMGHCPFDPCRMAAPRNHLRPAGGQRSAQRLALYASEAGRLADEEGGSGSGPARNAIEGVAGGRCGAVQCVSARKTGSQPRKAPEAKKGGRRRGRKRYHSNTRPMKSCNAPPSRGAARPLTAKLIHAGLV